jgi:hypothetical protein
LEQARLSDSGFAHHEHRHAAPSRRAFDRQAQSMEFRSSFE